MDSVSNKAKEKIDQVNEDKNLSSTVDDRKTEQGVNCREYDPLEYVRNYYKVPAVRGRIVFYKGTRGVITGASGPHVKVWLDGRKDDVVIHPNDLRYTEDLGDLPKLTRGQRNYRAWLDSETSETFIEFMRNPYWNDLRART